MADKSDVNRLILEVVHLAYDSFNGPCIFLKVFVLGGEGHQTTIGPGHNLFPIYCHSSIMSKPRPTASKSVPSHSGSITLPEFLNRVTEVYKQLQEKASPDQVHLLDTLKQMYTFQLTLYYISQIY